MKKSFWMVLLLAVVMVLAACGGKEEKKEETPNKQETTTAKPEEKKDESKSDENFFFQKGDVKVVMNEPAKAIIEALGEYKNTYEAPSCAFDGTDVVYAYNGFEVLAYAVNGEEKISGVVLRDDTVETPEGIAIGSDRAAVAAAYGEIEDGAASVTFTKGNCDLLIIFTEDKVSSIQYIAKEN